jgi:AAA domain (dynein-related subfamily)
MLVKELEDLLYKTFQEDSRRTVFLITGPPGIGKTAIPAQIAKAVKKQCITFALPSCEEVDLRGLPEIVNGRTQWASPLPKTGKGVLILDELTSAQPAVQVAAHHIVREEEGSSERVADGWHIVLTANGATDKTFYRAVPAPLRNRLTTIKLEPDLESWAGYANKNGVKPEVIAFLKWRPELLTCKDIPSDDAFPSPRSWESISDLLSLSVSASVERELLTGTVGAGPATEFATYLRMVRELPSIESILADQIKTPIPTTPSLLYALVISLAQHTRIKKQSAMKFIARMPAEFALLYIKEIRDDYDLRSDDDVRTWIGKHKTLFQREM